MPCKLRLLGRLVMLLVIEYRLAPFGALAFGRELVAYLYVEPSNGCSPFNVKSDFKTDLPYAILLSSKECSPQVQAMNAEHAGATILILGIVEEGSGHSKPHYSYDVKITNSLITTVYVDTATRNKLIDITEHYIEPVIKLKNDMPSSGVAHLEFNIITDDLYFYRQVKDLDKAIVPFDNKLKTSFQLFKGDEDNNDPKDIAKLQAMMNCIDFKAVYKLLGAFATDCVSQLKVTSTCFESTMQSLSRKKFLQWQNCYLRVVDSVLKDIESRVEASGRVYGSYIMINNRLYTNTLNSNGVFEAICTSFVHSPSNCLYINEKYTLSDRYTVLTAAKRWRFKMVLIISSCSLIVLLLAGMLILLLMFSRIYKQIMREKVEAVVKQTIDRYNGERSGGELSQA